MHALFSDEIYARVIVCHTIIPSINHVMYLYYLVSFSVCDTVHTVSQGKATYILRSSRKHSIQSTTYMYYVDLPHMVNIKYVNHIVSTIIANNQKR